MIRRLTDQLKYNNMLYQYDLPWYTLIVLAQKHTGRGPMGEPYLEALRLTL